MGRAYGNIGNAYSAAGFYEQAIKYHKQELTISKEVHDRSSEASTHGNLAVAYQALGAHDMALFHYRAHLGKQYVIKCIIGVVHQRTLLITRQICYPILIPFLSFRNCQGTERCRRRGLRSPKLGQLSLIKR